DEVYSTLISAGFLASNISVSYDYSDTIAAGNIISQNPGSGEFTAAETAVSFVVSQGAEEKPSRLNDISGYSKSEAQNYLSGIGAEYIGHETSEYSDTVDKDKVIRTNPGVGASIAKGDIVSVVYSKGPDPAKASSEKDSSSSSTKETTETTGESKEENKSQE
ncbi:MAG: PASTA domain-containing protein, partial [Enterococcus thailandicus]|nr:PASTA domain-containing protein [Enterococcus thailandicus]